jgi:hypothetical protein
MAKVDSRPRRRCAFINAAPIVPVDLRQDYHWTVEGLESCKQALHLFNQHDSVVEEFTWDRYLLLKQVYGKLCGGAEPNGLMEG